MNDFSKRLKIIKYSLGTNKIFELDEKKEVIINTYSVKHIKDGWYDQFELHPNQRKKIRNVYNWLEKNHPEEFI
jgi:hypothetical protein